jgi:hypothetical protein
MYSEIWFPDRLDSEKWLSSLLSILLNWNQKKWEFIIRPSPIPGRGAKNADCKKCKIYKSETFNRRKARGQSYKTYP